MKQTKEYQVPRGLHALGASLVLAIGIQSGVAYEFYSNPSTGAGNCRTCHGDFRGATSTKTPPTVFPSNNNHEMHRASANMGTACALCHTGADRSVVSIASSDGTGNNQGLGCNGCHNAVGLRKHHRLNGVTECLDCHDSDGTPPAETVKPPYYGTADTKVKNPANDVLAGSTNENWSVGDFLGLDNDGNDLYDLADYAVGAFRLLSTTQEGNNIRVSYITAGGRTNSVQAAGAVNGIYTNLGSAFKVAGIGLVTNNYLDVGGATNQARFYRLSGFIP
jgi:cytochrome c553